MSGAFERDERSSCLIGGHSVVKVSVNLSIYRSREMKLGRVNRSAQYAAASDGLMPSPNVRTLFGCDWAVMVSFKRDSFLSGACKMVEMTMFA